MRRVTAIVSVLAIFGAGAAAQQKGDDARTACTLKVSGMFCGACAKIVEKAAKKIDGVKSARASQPKGVAEVAYDPTKTSPEAIAKTITEKTAFKAEVTQKDKEK